MFFNIALYIQLFFYRYLGNYVNYIIIENQVFMKNGVKPTKEHIKGFTKKFEFVLKNINVFLLFLYCFLGTPKHLKSDVYTQTKLTTMAKKPQSFPLVLWLNEIRIYGTGLSCENESIAQGRSYIQKSIKISHCFFSRSSYISGNGGVININGGDFSMNVNCSMFYGCFCGLNGGAIYFYSTNSYLKMICAYRCSAASGLFAYFGASKMNKVEDISVSNNNMPYQEFTTFCLFMGDQKIDNTNSSMNNAEYVSGIAISSPSSFTSSLCTFSNNKARDRTCIFLYSASVTNNNVICQHCS